jgi:hypothetical protein
MIGLFIVGCFITAIVAAACAIVIKGIREDQAARERLPDEGIKDVRI